MVSGATGKSTATEKEAVTMERMMASPFYLSTSDAPGNLITTVQLKGENYEDWSKHVRNALRTKRKLGFIDGTVEKPTEDGELEQWGVVNSMLVAWIMNTIEPTLRTSISMVDDAKTLWDDLKMLFSAGNGPRISELRAEIANCRQNGDTITVYCGKMKKLWDELAGYKPIRECSCGRCTCDLGKQLREDRDEEQTNAFLTGLDSTRFGTVRSTIMSIEPLPKLTQVYQRMIREERQQTMQRNMELSSEAVGFSVKVGNMSQGREKDVTCTHCGKYGHTQADCHQLNGYPDWWGERGRGGGRGRTGRGGAGGRSGRGGDRGGNAGRVNSAQVA